MEHQAVGRVDEERDRHEDCRPRTVGARSRSPGDDGAREEDREQGLREPPPATSSAEPATMGVTGVRNNIDHGNSGCQSKNWM